MKTLALDINADVLINLLRVEDMDIPRAIPFDDDSASVETTFSVFSINPTKSTVTAECSC